LAILGKYVIQVGNQENIINRTWGGYAAEFKGKRHVGTRSECAFAQKGFARICRTRELRTKQ
jgi:hypothetical protein